MFQNVDSEEPMQLTVSQVDQSSSEQFWSALVHLSQAF